MLTRWEPFVGGNLNRLHNEMNRLFDRFGMGDSNSPALAYSYPPVNIWEDNEHVYAEAELPGMGQDDLEIYVSDGNQLTIRGERKALEQPNGVWHRQERGLGKFGRVLTLPANINADKVEARFEQGVLHLTMPKSPEAKPKKIAVRAE